jgi:DNA repair protein RecN (Recombination protein N)
MLAELRVENLLLIERADLRLAPGLNVLTGETGAGKTVLAHALDLLLGGRARAGIVRPGAAEAYVEGVFALPEALAGERGELLPADAEEVVLARRVSADGRTRAYVNGRSAAVADLRRLGEHLLAFYGQHEHRKLTLAAAQLEILDGFCGPEQAVRRAACAAAQREVRELRERLEQLRELDQARERELDLLEHELAEIDGTAPAEGEPERLRTERERLRRLDALLAAAGHAAEALAGGRGFDGGWGSDAQGAVALSADAAARLDTVAGVDPQLDALAERARALAIEAEDLAGDLRGHGERLQGEAAGAEGPGGLHAVEERLAAFERLMRKHGSSIAAVLEYGEHARARREELLGAAVALGETAALLEAAQRGLDEHVRALRSARAQAAPRLAEAVREQLAALAMPDATFAVELSPCEPGPKGGDAVEFKIAPNPGVPAGPLREIASGGELSRVMLALTTVRDGAGGGVGRGAGADNRVGRGAGADDRVGRGAGAADRVGRGAGADDRVGRGAGAADRVGRGAGADDGVDCGAGAEDGVGRGSEVTLVFDEVDAGIGGHTARAVGERLRDIAAARQVVCITHLPQIASLAARHFSVVKDTAAGDTRTSVSQLAEPDVLAELVRMLGAPERDASARRHARELRRAA